MRVAIARVTLAALGFFMGLMLLFGLFVVVLLTQGGLKLSMDRYRQNFKFYEYYRDEDSVPLQGIYNAGRHRFENLLFDYPTIAVSDIVVSSSAILALLVVSWCCFTWPWKEERRRQFGVLILLWGSWVIATGLYYLALMMPISVAHGRWDANMTRIRVHDGTRESFWDQASALDLMLYPLTFEAIHMETNTLARLVASIVGWGLTGCVLYWWLRSRDDEPETSDDSVEDDVRAN